MYRPNGDYFGTLCGLDPLPAKLKNTAVISSMTLFAKLLSLQLDSENKLADVRHELTNERESAELREKFVAVLGHDVRNPLGAIMNGADILLRQELPPRANTVVEMMRRSATRIANMIDDVVDFAHGKMGGGIPLQYRHESNLAGLLQQVIAELQSAYPLRKIVVDLDSPLPLRCDGPRLGQLFSNLLKNALLHGDPQHPVHVEARLNDSMFEVRVTNQGPCIAPEKLPHLFQPFWRDDTASISGLGLGLFIVDEIARAHGGKIDVKSENEQTTFRFTMSAEPNSPAAQ